MAYAAAPAEHTGFGSEALPLPIAKARLRENAPTLAAAGMAVAWSAVFGWLSLVRHLAGGTHAEDLGFTDQVLWNFLQLHGQWFRMSIYNGATWNTELDLSRLARPDSLLAFHFEPMLLFLIPIYAASGAVGLLILQAAAVGAGAIPVYRIARHATGSAAAGLSVGAAYLLSPLGQWAVLSDFHTSTLAAPLLILSAERLIVGGSPRQALLAAALAATAREDVGPALVAFGLTFVIRQKRVGAAFMAIGLTSSILGLFVIRTYSGGVYPFDVRYGPTFASGFAGALSALGRPSVVEYATTLLLSGGWLALLSPSGLLPALPSLALNVFSTSPWMSSGKAHYSALVLPFLVIGAAGGLRRVRGHPVALAAASVTLLVTGALGYITEGSGPLGMNYAPAAITSHADKAAAIAAQLPSTAAVSATSSLVPRVSERSRVYVFPAVLDADYVFLDLNASPAPTSAGDVYLRVQTMLTSGGWALDSADDGLMVLRRDTDALVAHHEPMMPSSPGSSHEARLLAAELSAATDGAVDVDGPRAVLRTTWLLDTPLPTGTQLEFLIELDNGEQLRRWDIADLWWNPPQRWRPGQPTSVEVPDIPMRHFRSWRPIWRRP